MTWAAPPGSVESRRAGIRKDPTMKVQDEEARRHGRAGRRGHRRHRRRGVRRRTAPAPRSEQARGDRARSPEAAPGGPPSRRQDRRRHPRREPRRTSGPRSRAARRVNEYAGDARREAGRRSRRASSTRPTPAIDKVVANGRIDQARGDELKGKVPARVDKVMNHHVRPGRSVKSRATALRSGAGLAPDAHRPRLRRPPRTCPPALPAGTFAVRACSRRLLSY